MSKKNGKPEQEKADAPATGGDDRAMLAISRALSDPRRVQVLRKIASCDATACMQVRESLEMSPATLSHHMKQLEACGLIETVRDGKFVRAHLCRKIWKGYLAYLKSLTS